MSKQSAKQGTETNHPVVVRGGGHVSPGRLRLLLLLLVMVMIAGVVYGMMTRHATKSDTATNTTSTKQPAKPAPNPDGIAPGQVYTIQ